MPTHSAVRSRINPAVLVLALVIVVAALATAFSLPAVHSGPRNVPIGVVAPEPIAAKVQAAIEAKQPGAFEITTYADENGARAAIENRDVYGALVVESFRATMLTAPAASPAVAQILNSMADGIGKSLGGGETVAVEQVAPLPSGDPLGSGFGVFMLPMVLGSIITGAATSILISGRARRAVTVAAVAVVAGIALAAIGGPWLGIFTGGFWATAGLIALGIAAGSFTVVGLHSLLGIPGIGLGVILVFLLGNPLSGVASAPELLPSGWSTLGQLLPPGALGTALRSVSYFDGAGMGSSLLVLLGWAVAGLLLLGLGGLVHRGSRKAQPAAAEAG